MMENLLGSLAIGIPAIIVALLLFWRNYRPVFWMVAGALVVGLGYLGFTGATHDIGQPIAQFVNEVSTDSMSSTGSSGNTHPNAGRYVD